MKGVISLRNLALVLVIIGALNWGLIGLFRYDLIAAIFGGQLATISRIIYLLVGIAGIYSISFFYKGDRNRVVTES
jgi:uncharacterized membrane protein YuzA (DUF378 family)